MKKFVLSMMVLGSAGALAACGNADAQRDATLTQAPYAEERTVGATAEPVRRPVVRSAQPVFEERQMK
jgi:hypothetical protein